MTDVKKIDGLSTNNKQVVTNPAEKEKTAKALLDAEIQRTLLTKKQRKEAVKENTEKFLQYGKANGEKVENEKEAKKLAKNYVENEYNKERSKYTNVFMDKELYEQAEKERKTERKELIEKYRQEGLKRREAKRMADAQLPENEYIKNKKTRAFVEEHKKEFYDEKGNFSSGKFKSKAVEYANTHTLDDEDKNYNLSLKERRKVAQEENTSAKVIKNIAKDSNIGYEKDNTNLYRGLAIAAGTAAGVAAGPLFGSSASASAAAAAAGAGSAVAGGAASDAASSSSAAAAAKASTNGYAIGAGVGLAVGTGIASFIKDKGKKEARVYAPGEKQENPDISQPDTPSQQPPKSTTQPDQTQPTAQTQPCPVTPDEEHEEYCDYKVKKGEYWRGIVKSKYTHEDGSKLTAEEEVAVVHELKKKHGITDFSKNIQPNVMRLYTEINGKKYNVDCDAEVKEKAKKYAPSQKYTGKAADGTSRYFFTDCNGNRSPIYNSKEERDEAMDAFKQKAKAA